MFLKWILSPCVKRKPADEGKEGEDLAGRKGLNKAALRSLTYSISLSLTKNKGFRIFMSIFTFGY
jgi:hypothetical protein